MSSSTEEFLKQVRPRQLWRGVALLLLAAFYSPTFVLSLAPVYGGNPANIFHAYGEVLAAAAGWFSKDLVERFSRRRAVYLLPILAIWTPTVEYFLLQQSSTYGNPAGPVITGLLSYYPLVFFSVACGGKLVQKGLNLSQQGDLAAEHVPLISSYIIYSIGGKIIDTFIDSCIGAVSIFSTVSLQVFTSVLYAAVVPSKLLLLAVPSIIFSLTSNVHLPFGNGIESVNHVLRPEGYAMLARQDSTTGYISVLENLEDGFRVMRCDHSLLGGQWTKMPRNYAPDVHDPIYAIFTMLEGVRLIETDSGEAREDAGKKALVVGLGIGTTPAALIKHGIETTIVEIDPVVHKFAGEYFHLPPNHIAEIEDATTFVQRTQKSNPAQYDYIVHDVFTGGTEPVELFTLEFMRGLHALLKPDGVIAINYAGDISLYPAGLAVRTIQAVFPTCRIYREDAPATAQTHQDFTNMVIFCKKSNATPLRFREPVEKDYLGSKAREAFLAPKHQHELQASRFADIEHHGRPVLIAKEAGRLHKYQDRGAIEHWKIMRDVMPALVWETW